MKPLLFILSLLMLTSCKKDVSQLQEKTTVYFYQLASKDVDGQIALSGLGIKPVRVVTINNNPLSIELPMQSNGTNDEGDDDKDPLYCAHHPGSEKCRVSLPMKLNYFEYLYDKQKQTIKFVWETNFEDNIDKFFILKSKDGVNFDIIATITPHGSLKEYNYIENIW